ncbi:futalosine hydrolase [Solwaraspora sp. WMMB335]|uniref:futalosine hydrolase n=1 Tax=Solwaraspora sp. WMMB335 TaxID=3404118 RepID=UPI003B943014
MRILVVTAVDAEATAVRHGLVPAAGGRMVEVAVVGVGSAAAAAGTSRQLALAASTGRPYHAVISAGIGGGFPGRVEVGQTVLATRCVAADLGAESPDGFLSLDELGFGSATAPVDRDLTAWLRAALPAATTGAVLTMNTVTGTAASAAALAARHPDAVAEAMEGYGVACAAGLAGLPFAELRTISNAVGPRDRSGWRIPAALAALTTALTTLTTALTTLTGTPAAPPTPTRPAAG